MRNSLLYSLAALALLSGCATFKELEPEPPLSPRERGYIELTNDKESFRLSEGKCYFIKFPRPEQDNYTLILRNSAAWDINAYLTSAFDDGKEPIVRMPDEASETDSTSIFAIDRSAPSYFWVIDTVRQDVDLRLHYRYVPRWRFTFENKYVEFKSTLAGNKVGRSTYLGSANVPSIQSVDFREELVILKTRSEALAALQAELKEVANLFPADIAAGNDTAYQNYKSIRAALDDELQFQENYAEALRIFQQEKSSRGKTAEFLDDAPSYLEFLSRGSRYPASLLSKVRETIGNRLGEVAPFYEQQLQGKKEVRSIALKPSVESVTKLFRSCNRPLPSEFEAITGFVQRFNLEVAAVKTANDRLREMNALINKTVAPPPPNFYGDMEVSASDIRSSIPQSESALNVRYGTLEAAQAVARELAEVSVQADDVKALLTSSRLITADIGARAWANAEQKTADLFLGRDGRSYASVAHHREKFVKWFESDIFNGVKSATKERLDAFVKISQASFANVPALYADSAFLPAAVLTFSSIGEPDLAKKRAQIAEYIARVRQFDFPEASIRTLYAEFTRDMSTYGVERARAIVEHGKMYKGADKQLAGFVNECDPTIAKWIVRPKEYRRILAFPVTSNKRGVNEYVFRVKLQIPSDAAFPVFDIYVKLPKEVAEAGTSASWYERITINNNPIKNEGRFRITAPLADNNYESQITPVQMDKAGNNILEVRFKKASFKVYEISTMAQVPIMKKN